MKKYFALLYLLFVIPSYAVCPLDNAENAVCTLPEFREQITPIFQQNNGLSPNISTPAFQLTPLNRADPINQMRESNNNLNYSSGCQFGVCLQNPEKSKLPEMIKSGIKKRLELFVQVFFYLNSD